MGLDHWIHRQIVCKGECQRWAPKNPEDERCGCGRDKDKHSAEAIALNEKNSGPWGKLKDCQEVPTNAYGKIKFILEDTDQTPDFLRISDSMCETEEGLQKLIDLMTLEELWGMDEHREPNLLISVTGGAKDFDVETELKNNFAKGLCAAAKSANAWIVTGGTDAGVMKMVGDAVYNYPGEITTIGVATWGIIKGKHHLLRTNDKSAAATFDYDGTTGKMSSTAPLNPHHTHFILVDNGTDRKFGGEMAFRAKLERKIAETYPIEKSASQQEIPIIQVILNGGPNSALTCLLSMRQNIPLLVIKGSGNCADVIARAKSCSDLESGRLSEHGKMLVEEEINTHFPQLPDSVKKDIMSYVKEIIQMDHLLTIYSLESKDLDHALLFALIKSKTENNSAIEQMSMAINWNRPELATEILKMETVQFNDDQLTTCMEQAILSDRKDFISIFLNEGIEMKSFLTYSRLESMFRYKPEGSTHLGKKRFFKVVERLLPRIKSRSELTMKDIGHLLVNCLQGGFINPLKKINDTKLPENPYDLLMIYCVLNDCNAMADLIWEQTYSPISTALIAFRIYKFHAEYTCSLTAYDQEAEEFCLQESQKYEEYACKSLTQCPKLFNKDDTFLLLNTPHGFWGGHSLLGIATMVSSDKFLAHGAVQNFLSDLWMGEMKSTESFLKIACCSWFVFPLFLKYEQRERTSEEIQALSCNEYTNKPLNPVDDNGDIEMNNKKKKKKKMKKRDSLESKRKYDLHWYQKIFACLSSPIVKFQSNLFWFVIFLIIYAYVLVADHGSGMCAINSKSSIPVWELYLVLFVVGTLPTEILQLIKNPASNPVTKVFNHFSSFFNCVDGLAIFTYFVSFVIRASTLPLKDPNYLPGKDMCEYILPRIATYHNEDFSALNVGHVLNVISFMFYVIRAMDYFKISAQMGPKVIMIFAMIKDLAFFIMILLLFVFAYSIGAQAIIRPNKNLAPHNKDYLFHLLFYRPYLMAMGEFGIEEFVVDFKIDHCNIAEQYEHCDGDDLSGLLENSTIATVHYYMFVAITISYIMIANILLVNLLIAIFSNTYERLQDNSQELYLVQKAEMIMDFEHRTIMPNPFSLPEHLWMFGRWIYYLCFLGESFHRGTVIETDYHKMTKIERACADEYAAHKGEEEAGFVKDTLKELRQSLISVKNILNNANLGSATRQASTSLETCDISPTGDPPSKEHTDAQIMAMDTAGIFKKIAVSERPIEIHVDARTSPYHKTNIERTVVRDSQVPWKAIWNDYSPVEYTKQRAVEKPNHHDDEHRDDETLPPALIKTFNKYRDGINRKSFLGVYNLDERGRPVNPRGRTGISGKGNLKRWGPNHQGDVIVTRWMVDESGKAVIHPEDGRRILEFVAVEKQGQWAIPGGRIVEGEKLVDTLEREFSEEALGSLDMPAEKRKECMRMVDRHFSLGINVYQGYVDDPSNTDNAWYETTALNYHDSDGSSFSNFPLNETQSTDEEEKRAKSKWITLDVNIDLYANHEVIIQKVCFHRNAYCPIADEPDTIDEDSGRKLKKKKSSRWGFFIDQTKQLEEGYCE